MEAAKDKVRPIKEAPQDSVKVPEDFLTRSQRDGGKVALFVAILAILLVAILFFSLNQNITGLGQKVDELASLRESVQGLDQQLAELGVQTRNNVARLDNRINTETQNVRTRSEEQYAAMDGRMVEVEGRLENLDELAAEAKRMVMSSMLQELTQRVGYLSQQVEGEEQARNLAEARKLLEQVQTEMDAK